MALQASGGNPPTNSISFSQIVTEFGQNSSSSLGGYRMNNLNIINKENPVHYGVFFNPKF